MGYADIPCPRIGCAITADQANIYVFGGKSEASRLNDTWAFGLSDYKFHKMKDDGEIPYIRNGHTINHHEGKLYVFGGIHDVTW
jgi:N-acetylneuraminic acid mutarotase